MAKSKLLQPLPWYRWNPSKWQGSRKVQRMDWAAKGLYRELMDECWIKGNIPSTVSGIAGLFDVEESEIASLVSQVIRCFVVTDETMMSPFIEEVRTEMDDMRVANSLNARKRWDKVREDGNADSCDGIDNDAMASKTMREEKRREEKRREESTPLPPKGGRKQKAKTDLDCQPENEESIRRVYDSWPKVNPGGEPAKKGSFAQAARAFQRIINTGEATARELKSCGLLYAKAEAYPERLRQRIFEAWDHRDRAVMHVATFYGPDKRPYRQMLAIARDVIAESDSQARGVAS